MDDKDYVFGRENLQKYETFRYGGIMGNYHYTVKDFKRNHISVMGEDAPFEQGICSCCKKEIPEDEHLYMGAFYAKPDLSGLLLRTICKDCAYSIADYVIEADGVKHYTGLKPSRKGHYFYRKGAKPEFSAMLTLSDRDEYWLFHSIEDALDQMHVFLDGDRTMSLYRPKLNHKGEWKLLKIFYTKGKNSYTRFDDEYEYDINEYILHMKWANRTSFKKGIKENG